jgi:hypothetical protein
VSLLDQALDVLRARQSMARALGVELVGVVGSVARGEERPDSDVDVVYERIGKPSLFDLGGLLMDLQDDLGRGVDLIDPSAMKPDRWTYMSRDLVRLS